MVATKYGILFSPKGPWIQYSGTARGIIMGIAWGIVRVQGAYQRTLLGIPSTALHIRTQRTAGLPRPCRDQAKEQFWSTKNLDLLELRDFRDHPTTQIRKGSTQHAYYVNMEVGRRRAQIQLCLSPRPPDLYPPPPRRLGRLAPLPILLRLITGFS